MKPRVSACLSLTLYSLVSTLKHLLCACGLCWEDHPSKYSGHRRFVFDAFLLRVRVKSQEIMSHAHAWHGRLTTVLYAPHIVWSFMLWTISHSVQWGVSSNIRMATQIQDVVCKEGGRYKRHELCKVWLVHLMMDPSVCLFITQHWPRPFVVIALCHRTVATSPHHW
jgi:hypothetical protein